MIRFFKGLILLLLAFLPTIVRCAEFVLWPWWVVFLATFGAIVAVSAYVQKKLEGGIIAALLAMILLPLVLRVAGFVSWPWIWVIATLCAPMVLCVAILLPLSLKRRDQKK